jgi:16S rRNA G966 N2-methylase RsmD
MPLKQLNIKIEKLISANNRVSKKDPITFYWTRKDPNLLLNILDNFSKDGDVVYDPFLGSAPILYSIDASEKNISFVGSEINEMPISFIKFNLNDFDEVVISNLQKKYFYFYEKYIHLFQYKSPLYDEDITLSKLIFDKKDNGVVVKEFIFANNEKLKVDKSDQTNLNLLQNIYIERHKKLSELIKGDDVDLITNSRIAIKDGMKLSHLFNPINFYVLKEFSKEFQNDHLMLNILSSILHLCRLTDLKSQSQFPYWVPNKDIVERNVLLVIQKKITEIIKYKNQNSLKLKLVNNFKDLKKNVKGVLIINKASQLITNDEIPNKSIDLVITDPPYFDQVAYSEYLKIWEHICHLQANLKDEIVLSNRKVNPSSEKNYLDNLTKCFTVVENKLKDEGIVIIFFKDSKPNNIHLFLKSMEDSGFSFLRSVHIGNKKFTYKQNTTQDTTVSGECLFFFTKSKNMIKKLFTDDTLTKSQINLKIESVVISFAQKYLEKNGKGSLGELYDNGLLFALYENDLLRKIANAKIVVEILNSKFKLMTDRNYTIE